MIEYQAPGVALTVSPADGGRITSLRIGGYEIFVTSPIDDPTDNPELRWGCYPMVPWAGRVRHGRFRFDGRDISVPVNLAPHAIHGSGFASVWDVDPDGSLVHEFPSWWPFGGHAVERFKLASSSLTATIEVHADDRPMPAQAGFHPWFRRPVRLRWAPGSMYAVDADGLPDGRLVAPPPGPWDNCFTQIVGAPQLQFDDGPTVIVSSTTSHWVLYDQPAHAICLEPQTGPPDGFNLAPFVVEPGQPLSVSMTLAWGN